MTDHMYLGDRIDEQKVLDQAFKKSRDPIYGTDVMVHKHKHADNCNLLETTAHGVQQSQEHIFFKFDPQERKPKSE